MKNKVSIILPVITLEDGYLELYKNAVNSILEQKVKPSELVVVYPKGVEVKDVMDYKGFKVKFVQNKSNDTSFQAQVNLGVEKSKHDHFSILCVDDEYSLKYFKIIDEVLSSEKEIYEGFLPIILNSDIDNPFLGFSNEMVWAEAMAEKEGVLDLNLLKNFDLFTIYGGIFKKDSFLEVGGLKSSIKVSFIHEFLMRFVHNGKQIKTIPHLGYKRIIGLKGSLTNSYMDMDVIELNFWVDVPQKEYLYTSDRGTKYFNNDDQ